MVKRNTLSQLVTEGTLLSLLKTRFKVLIQVSRPGSLRSEGKDR